MARLIGTPAGRAALRSWAEDAPHPTGASSAHAPIGAVQQGMGHPCAAAALIGACDASAALLSDPDDAAFAIRRWGHANAAAPSAWATALAPAERDRLIATALSSSFACAFCLPWLPPDAANRTRIETVTIATTRSTPVLQRRRPLVRRGRRRCSARADADPEISCRRLAHRRRCAVE